MRWPWQRRKPEPAPPEDVPEELPTDPLRVFRALEAHGVDFIVIGGLAVQAHGHPRTTRDVDLVVAPEFENMRRLVPALRELRARLAGVDAHLLDVDPLDPGHLHRGGNFTLATTAGRVDLWTRPEDLLGLAPWPDLRRRSAALAVRGVTIRVVGRDDLIAMKRAAGRPRDIEDIAALTDPRSRARERSGEERPPLRGSRERSRDRPGPGHVI